VGEGEGRWVGGGEGLGVGLGVGFSVMTVIVGCSVGRGVGSDVGSGVGEGVGERVVGYGGGGWVGRKDGVGVGVSGPPPDMPVRGVSIFLRLQGRNAF